MLDYDRCYAILLGARVHTVLHTHLQASQNVLELWKQHHKWASSWDNCTYNIGDRWRLRRACASAQSRQSLHCSHTWSMEVDERVRPKIRRLAPLDVCACAFEEWVYGGRKVPKSHEMSKLNHSKTYKMTDPLVHPHRLGFLCQYGVAMDQQLIHANSTEDKLWSDYADMHADLSHRHMHVCFCRFCYQCCRTAPVELGLARKLRIGWAIIWREERNKMTGTTLF